MWWTNAILNDVGPSWYNNGMLRVWFEFWVSLRNFLSILLLFLEAHETWAACSIMWATPRKLGYFDELENSITLKVERSHEDILGYSLFDWDYATCALDFFFFLPNPFNEVVHNCHLVLKGKNTHPNRTSYVKPWARWHMPKASSRLEHVSFVFFSTWP